MYVRTIVALTALALFTAHANAQTAKRPSAPPAASKQAPPAGPSGPARPVGAVGAPGGSSASTNAEAIALFKSRTDGREAGCRGKGRYFKWVPPHMAGDARPQGGFYTSHSNGTCKIDAAAVRAAGQ